MTIIVTLVAEVIYKVKSLIICTLQLIFLGWLNQKR